MKHTVDETARVGWASPIPSMLAHYFHGYNSVCGKFMWAGKLSRDQLRPCCGVCEQVYNRDSGKR